MSKAQTPTRYGAGRRRRATFLIGSLVLASAACSSEVDGKSGDTREKGADGTDSSIAASVPSVDSPTVEASLPPPPAPTAAPFACPPGAAVVAATGQPVEFSQTPRSCAYELPLGESGIPSLTVWIHHPPETLGTIDQLDEYRGEYAANTSLGVLSDAPDFGPGSFLVEGNIGGSPYCAVWTLASDHQPMVVQADSIDGSVAGLCGIARAVATLAPRAG